MSEFEKSEAIAANASSFGISRLNSGSLHVTVGSKVSPKSLHDIIDQAIRLHGCLACGLGGLDLIIHAQDELINQAFQQIDEVRDVTVLR